MKPFSSTPPEKKRIGYMILMEREAFDRWHQQYFAPVEGETMGDSFVRRQFEIDGEKVFVIDDDYVRFSTKEEALEALNHPDYITRGGGLPKYKFPSLVCERAVLNPEWESAPYIAVICLPVPKEKAFRL